MRYLTIALILLAGSIGAAVLVQQRASAPPAADESFAVYASTIDSVRLPGGRAIHFTCMGQGSPTVILTAGLGDWSLSWGTVQPEIAKTTRACAWDRGGFGLSDAGPQEQSSAMTTADLEAALAQGTIPGPYIMVGHSLGSYESLLYTDRHRDAVAGMVLVDPSVPGQFALMKRVAPAFAEANDTYTKGIIAQVRACARQARGAASPSNGSVRPDCGIVFRPTYSPVVLRGVMAEFAKPGQGEAIATFFGNAALSSEQAVNPARDYGGMPLIVLTATVRPLRGDSAQADAQAPLFVAALDREHDKLAALSRRGVNARVPGATHYIHQVKPQVVIDAVNAVIAEARAAKP